MVSRIVRPPPLGRLRLARVDDAPIIMELVNQSMAENFRIHDTSNIVDLIENCVLSICQLDINEAIVAFLAAKDYPLIPAVHPKDWENYIWTKYKSIELNARNTLFLHLLCWDPIYNRDVVDNLLKSIFMHDPYVHHIGMVKCILNNLLLVPGQSRSEASFRRVQVIERGVPGDQLSILFIADRQEVSPRLRIRRAVEEDNDDIVPIIERHSERLRQTYGEFYVSELIARHPESDRVLLVCEDKELAVGVMCLNTQINYEALEESFELSPFAGLRHVNDPYHKRNRKADISTVSFTTTTVYNVADSMPGSNDTNTRSRNTTATTGVTLVFDEVESNQIYIEYVPESTNKDATSPAFNGHIDILNLLEDEDEELEFDIVNIDTDLLRVPQILTYDNTDGGLADSIMNKLDDTVKHNKELTLVEDKSSKKEKSKKQIASVSTYAPDPVRYLGTSNAFLLELFAMHVDYDERYGFDMLEVAFELFPKCDYCIMCLPSSHPPFPLLEHFTLVTPHSTRMRFINETLYVAHVNSVRGNVRLRPGEASDMQYIGDILEHTPRAQTLLELFESTFSSSTLSSYVLLSQNQPIGMVILGPLEDGTAVRTQYDLEAEPRRPGTDATVLAGVMSPTLEPHGRWYMRDLLRQSQYSSLFWICRLFGRGDMCPSRNLMSLTGHMVPVHPRRSVPNISGNKDLDKIFQDVSIPFALWVIERPLTSLPKVYVNTSIVVVGASRTGLAFLETLITGPTAQYLTFSNITLVSEHGLPTVVECLKAADICVPQEGRYSDRYLKSIPFYFYVDVISAVMVQIDRQKKCIHLKGGGVKYYDELVLTCGQQFQHPDYLKESLELVQEVEEGKPCDRILMDDPKYHPDRVPPPPDMLENLMLINSLFEANMSMRKLMRLISESKDTDLCLSENNQVVVYGECLEVYSCIAALLELGLAASMIAFVEPFPSEDNSVMRVNCFNNETVDQRVQANLDQLGVRVFRRCTLSSWRQRDSRVVSLNLMSPLHAIKLPCFALFYYGIKAIDVNAFKAINACGLVYEGGVVVGAAMDTIDAHVRAAGPATCYSRRLHAAGLNHVHYCSEDVGEALAMFFLRKLDPFVIGNPQVDRTASELLPRYSSSLLAYKGSHASIDKSSITRISLGSQRRWQPVMKFESPIVQCATVLGQLYYLKIRKPGPELPMEVQLSLSRQGHTLITDVEGNYFRLQLNALHRVEAITCLSKKSFSSEILSQLYGKHESFFNKLLARFELGEIVDLYSFFTQPWMGALYQETFDELLRDINEQDVGTVYDLVKSRFTFEDEKPKSAVTSGHSSVCSKVPSCGFGPKEARNLGTFRSIIDRFLARTSSAQRECGQGEATRGEARAFWNAVGGDSIVVSHLTRYLGSNTVTNPHYAKPSPEFI
ncbi:cilia- and flagella-associated protein 61-like [Achroia grisella]|uniref:cilia- and flagella-associated protein 61-like n=1 Tax=Achroia grisella TaxID=688607 RepID=UPI0027D2DF43|nr:cilia- and flagella-associated protein 61-like [Achroia grisella]